MAFFNFENPKLENRQIRRVTVGHALWLAGDVAENIDLTGTSLNPAQIARYTQLMSAYGEQLKLKGIEVVLPVRIELEDV